MKKIALKVLNKKMSFFSQVFVNVQTVKNCVCVGELRNEKSKFWIFLKEI